MFPNTQTSHKHGIRSISLGKSAPGVSISQSANHGAPSLNLNAAQAARVNLLSQVLHGSILITSRSTTATNKLVGSVFNLLKVEPLSQNEALALFYQKHRQLNASEADIKELMGVLDHMPLAITQAAVYVALKAPHSSVQDYLRELRRHVRGRARLLQQDAGDIWRDGAASNSIIRAWHISFEHIEKERPTTTHFLSLMSLFDRQGIPGSLLYRYEGIACSRAYLHSSVIL